MSDFHFLRPWWLLALLPCAALLWRLWSASDPVRRWRGIIAPELLPHLVVSSGEPTSVGPLAMLATAWGVAVVALAGPSWMREPAPFGNDEAALVVVLKVTPSMEGDEIAPTRLARSVQKIHDLLAIRPGARTALVAYSGSAHQVMPLTTDADIVSTFAGELSPKTMPREGDDAAAALALSDGILARSNSRGWVLWIADGVDGAQLPALKKRSETAAPPVTILAMCGEGPERQALLKSAASLDIPVVVVTPDDADVHQLAANTRFSSVSDGTGERWRDSGYWLVPILCALCLGWFRQGWEIGNGS